MIVGWFKNPPTDVMNFRWDFFVFHAPWWRSFFCFLQIEKVPGNASGLARRSLLRASVVNVAVITVLLVVMRMMIAMMMKILLERYRWKFDHEQVVRDVRFTRPRCQNPPQSQLPLKLGQPPISCHRNSRVCWLFVLLFVRDVLEAAFTWKVYIIHLFFWLTLRTWTSANPGKKHASTHTFKLEPDWLTTWWWPVFCGWKTQWLKPADVSICSPPGSPNDPIWRAAKHIFQLGWGWNHHRSLSYVYCKLLVWGVWWCGFRFSIPDFERDWDWIPRGTPIRIPNHRAPNHPFWDNGYNLPKNDMRKKPALRIQLGSSRLPIPSNGYRYIYPTFSIEMNHSCR